MLMDGAEVVVVVPNGCIHAAGSVRLVVVAVLNCLTKIKDFLIH